MSLKNARTLGLRIDAADNKILEQFEAETHIEAVSLLRAAFKAALKRYAQKGSLTVPLHIVDDADFKTLLRQKVSEAAPATSALVLNETSAPTNIESIPPRMDITYDFGTKRKKKSGTED